MPFLRSYVIVLGSFFEYDTAKVVHIPSNKVSIVNRCIQLAIVFYTKLQAPLNRPSSGQQSCSLFANTPKHRGCFIRSTRRSTSDWKM